MRWLKNLARYSTFSVLLGTAAFSAAGGVGCAEETFKCCECKFAACDATDPTTMMPIVDGAGAPVTTGLTRCDCPEGGYTYGECGVFCKERLGAQLPVIQLTPLCACQSAGCGNDSGTTCYEPVAGAPPLTLLTCTDQPDPKLPPVIPDVGQSVAKNSCSPGSPVGEN
jgi:hypothetical protein